MRNFLLLIAFLPMFFGPAAAEQQKLRIGFQTAEMNVLQTNSINTGLFEKQKLGFFVDCPVIFSSRLLF